MARAGPASPCPRPSAPSPDCAWLPSVLCPKASSVLPEGPGVWCEGLRHPKLTSSTRRQCCCSPCQTESHSSPRTDPRGPRQKAASSPAERRQVAHGKQLPQENSFAVDWAGRRGAPSPEGRLERPLGVRDVSDRRAAHGTVMDLPSDSLGQPPQVSETWRPSSSRGLRKGLYDQDGLKDRGAVRQDLWEGRGLSCLDGKSIPDTSQGALI